MYTVCVPDMTIANGNLSLPFSLFLLLLYLIGLIMTISLYLIKLQWRGFMLNNMQNITVSHICTVSHIYSTSFSYNYSPGLKFTIIFISL